MLNLTFVGTGASLPRVGHGNVAFVADCHNEKVLFECGPGILAQLAAAGVAGCEIRYLVVTHLHGDHTLGFPMLVLERVMEKYTEPLTVICPEDCVSRLEQLVALVNPEIAPDLDAYCRFIPVQVQQPYRVELGRGMSLSTRPSAHTVPGISVRLDCGDGSLTYSGDTALSAGLAEFAAGTSVLIHEATYSATLDPDLEPVGHSTARGAAEIARRAGAERLVLVHTDRRYAGREEVLVQEASDVFPGEVLLPLDLDRLVIE